MLTQTFIEFFFARPDQALLIFSLIIACVARWSPQGTLRLINTALLAAVGLCLYKEAHLISYFDKIYVVFLLSLVAIDALMAQSYNMHYYSEKKMFLLFWAVAGHLLIRETNWISFYLGIEMSTLPFYALSALSSHPQSLEGALKYFIANAFFSVLWLLSLVFVLTGSFDGLQYAAISLQGVSGICFSGLTIGLVALKLGCFPCAYWAPDFYQISSRSTIIWVSFVPKFLILSACAHLIQAFPSEIQALQDLFLALIVLGTLWGHLGAFFQSNVQRFLGYTAAAQIGFMFAPLIIQGPAGLYCSLVYLVIYTLSLLSFLYGLQRSFLENVLMIMRTRGKYGLYPVAYFAGLLSLAGYPPMPGFFAKLGVIMLLIKSNYISLAIFLSVANLLALFYYMDWIFKTRSEFVGSEV